MKRNVAVVFELDIPDEHLGSVMTPSDETDFEEHAVEVLQDMVEHGNALNEDEHIKIALVSWELEK